MEEPIVENILKEFSHLPKFPDGRINYTNSNKAPVLICFIKYKGKILLLKRSNKVRTYKGLWDTVAGYIDEIKPIEDKILEESNEEIGISEKIIKRIKVSNPYEIFDQKIQITWIIFPALIELKEKPKIKLDFEHTEYKWLKPEEINKFNTPPNLEKSLKLILNKTPSL